MCTAPSLGGVESIMKLILHFPIINKFLATHNFFYINIGTKYGGINQFTFNCQTQSVFLQLNYFFKK